MLRRILIISLFLVTNCYADFPPVHWTEMDTDPSYYPTTIIMPAGSLSSVSTGIVVTFTGGAGGGDEITVNTTAATNANFLDNIYIDWAINAASTPDDITAKPNYAETLAGNPALLTTECIFTADGLLCEGTTADTIEIKLAFPDPVTTDKTLTFPNATDTLVGKATTDTLTNKTIDATNTVTINAADITDQNAGTDITADLEEEVTEGSLADSVIVSADIKDGTIVVADTAITAGRSLTWSTNDMVADAELYTDTKCIYIEDPVAADDLLSIWYAKNAATLTSIWAESDQTVTFMLQVDDGTPADCDTVDLAPAAGTAEDTALDGDATMAAGDRLDLAVTSVANTPTWCSICWTYTMDD